MSDIYSGALYDNRDVKEKEKDFSIKELGASSVQEIPYLSRAKALKQIKEIRNQATTSSCGAHAGELAASHLNDGKIFSRAKLYRFRQNYSDQGMYIYDIGKIMRDVGLADNDNITASEEVYNAIKKEITAIAHIGGYTVDDTPTFEELAYTSNVLKLPQVILLYAKDGKEYGKECPIADESFSNPQTARIRHFVCIPPNGAFINKKKKYLIIQDSAGFGGLFVRQFSEEWVSKRVLSSMAVMGELKKESDRITRYVFKQDLKVGDKNEEVAELQLTLQELGFFPQIQCTGYYGGITRKAVEDFQKKYEKSILWSIGLKLPTGYFGKSTRKKLNEIIAESTQ
jgi:hypothetical protein